MARIFLIVLDSLGIGAMPDAAAYGDAGANTLRSIHGSPHLHIPHLKKLGLYNIDGIDFAEPVAMPLARHARLAEASAGKDTTVGHWEIAGLVSKQPFPTYPQGFPPDVMEAFTRQTRRGYLCNRPYSGTDVIRDYGDEHIRTGNLIVYTSADSVFQVAAHEEKVPLSELYRCCEAAREILAGPHGVARVIARPFAGTSGAYVRIAGRHDYSLAPPGETMLDILKNNGRDVIGIGKISDIFAGRGLTQSIPTKDNAEGISRTLDIMQRDFCGLCFTNLVDFDMLYGHRNDIDGYARALSHFDEHLPEMLGRLRPDDQLIITADHGCDPGFSSSTDHSREYVPLLIYGREQSGANLGTLDSFAVVAEMVLARFKMHNA